MDTATPECYLCGAALRENIDGSTNDHDEHVIPQSLGGRLKARGILCKECGGEKFLGGSIDKPMSDMFRLITGRLDMANERATSPVPIKAKLSLLKNGDTIDVHFSGGKIFHRKPAYEIDRAGKKVKVYGNEVAAREYEKKAQQELKRTEADWKDYSFEVISDLSNREEFAGVVEFPFQIDNQVFAAGFTKIALEFALSKGVRLNTVAHLIDRGSRTLKTQGVLCPYFPVVEAEKMIEYVRASVDPNFMSHTLVLFSQSQIDPEGVEQKQLYCFVELFGTFQYFVILNDHYEGDDIEPVAYAQRITYSKPHQEDIERLSPKDLSIYLAQVGVSLKDIAGKSPEEVDRLIRHQLGLSRYEFEYAANIKMIVEDILRQIMLEQDKDSASLIPGIIGHFYKNVETDDFRLWFFRSRFVRNGKCYSLLSETMELYQKDRAKLHDYTFFKFQELKAFLSAKDGMTSGKN